MIWIAAIKSKRKSSALNFKCIETFKCQCRPNPAKSKYNLYSYIPYSMLIKCKHITKSAVHVENTIYLLLLSHRHSAYMMILNDIPLMACNVMYADCRSTCKWFDYYLSAIILAYITALREGKCSLAWNKTEKKLNKSLESLTKFWFGLEKSSKLSNSYQQLARISRDLFQNYLIKSNSGSAMHS